MTRDEAIRIAQTHLNRIYQRAKGHPEVVIAESAIWERPYGWLLMYDTAEAIATGDPERGLIGNGPLLVLRESGRIIEFSSYYSGESALTAYEEDPSRFPPVRD